MSKSIEEQVYREFSEAVNSGDLEGAFKNATEDMTFRPIGTHPELGREFKGHAGHPGKLLDEGFPAYR